MPRYAWWVLVCALAASLGFGLAWRLQDANQVRDDRARELAAQEVQRLRARASDAASAGYEGERARLRTEFVTITEVVEKIIEKPVYRSECFDADGLRALSAAIGASGAATGKPARAVP